MDPQIKTRGVVSFIRFEDKITDCRPSTVHGIIQAATFHEPLNIRNLFRHRHRRCPKLVTVISIPCRNVSGGSLTGSKQKSAVARAGVPMDRADFEVDAMAE